MAPSEERGRESASASACDDWNDRAGQSADVDIARATDQRVADFLGHGLLRLRPRQAGCPGI